MYDWRRARFPLNDMGDSGGRASEWILPLFYEALHGSSRERPHVPRLFRLAPFHCPMLIACQSGRASAGNGLLEADPKLKAVVLGGREGVPTGRRSGESAGRTDLQCKVAPHIEGEEVGTHVCINERENVEKPCPDN